MLLPLALGFIAGWGVAFANGHADDPGFPPTFFFLQNNEYVLTFKLWPNYSLGVIQTYLQQIGFTNIILPPTQTTDTVQIAAFWPRPSVRLALFIPKAELTNARESKSMIHVP